MTDDLDRVLQGLGRVEAPVGLEGRLLRALEAPQERGFAWGWVGILALVLMVVAVGSWGLHRHAKMVGFADTPPFHTAERTGHPVVVENGQAVVVSERRRGSSTAHGAENAPRSPQNDAHSVASVAEGGLLAPAEGLTEQEKLLLRLARHANGGTLAMFDPRIREERAAAEKAEFEFFNPQPAVVAAEPEETDHVGKQIK